MTAKTAPQGAPWRPRRAERADAGRPAACSDTAPRVTRSVEPLAAIHRVSLSAERSRLARSTSHRSRGRFTLASRAMRRVSVELRDDLFAEELH